MITTDDKLDLITGYEAIGAYLGWTPRQLKYRARTGAGLPLFRIGRTPAATRDALRRWAAETEARQLATARR